MRTFPEAIRPLVPLILLFAISTIWIVRSPNNILEKDPRIIYFAIGTIFSNICVRYILKKNLFIIHLLSISTLFINFIILQCRLIVSQMSNTRCEILPWILLPIAIAAVFSFILPNIDLESMYLVSIIALFSHVHYGTCVVSFTKSL